jgi:hypothetical protein
MRVFSSLLALLVVLAGAATAAAQPNAAAAEALFRAGRDASQRGDVQTACTKYRESYRLDPALGTLLNIAVCEETLGELASAWQHYQELIHSLPQNDERVVIAREHLATLDPRLPRVTLRKLEGAPEDTHVWLAGTDLGAAAFDTPLPMDAGSYTFEARADGRQPQTFALTLALGDRVELGVAPGAALPQPAVVALSSAAHAPSPNTAQPGADRPRALSTQRVVAYGLLGGAAVSFVAFGVTGALALDRKLTADDHCDEQNRCDPDGIAAVDSGKTLYPLMLISAGVALAAGAAGTYLLLTDSDDVGSSDEAHASRTALSLSPELSARSAGARLRGHF